MSPIENLAQQLIDYGRRYPEELALVEAFSRFLEIHQFKSFDRALSVGHITASCCLLNTNQTHVLLTHHRKLNSWIQLGGHADGETSPLAVAVTEAREESGINDIETLLDGNILDLDRHIIPARKNEAEHYHYDFRFAMRTRGNDDYIVSDESLDLRWVKLDEIDAFVSDQSVLKMVDKWRGTRSTVARGQVG